MLNNTEIQPALTAEEWAEALTPQSEYEFYKTRGDVLLGWATSEAQELGRADPTYGLAAYALFRSGRGFTREDLKALSRCADNAERWASARMYDSEDHNAHERTRTIIQRIEALLPPE